MGIVNIEDLQAGMVLAKDVKEQNGNVLLTAGTTIESKHLSIFKAWGVFEADVEGVDQEDMTTVTTARLDPELLQEARIHADKIFKYNQRTHPAIDTLYNIFIVRKVRQLAEDGKNGH